MTPCEGSSGVERPAIQPEGDGSTPIPSLQLYFQECPYLYVKEFVETNHYSHNLNGVTAQHCFGAYHDGRMVGAMVFGWMSTSSSAQSNPTYSHLPSTCAQPFSAQASRCLTASGIGATCFISMMRSYSVVGLGFTGR
jgi:hypothetical protein